MAIRELLIGLKNNINQIKGQTHLLEGTGQHYTFVTKQDVIDYIDDAISKFKDIIDHTDKAVSEFEKEKQTPEAVLNSLTEEFLKYKLPQDVCADGCVARSGREGEERYGTNLLNYGQAYDMFSTLLKNYEINKQPTYVWGVDWSKHAGEVNAFSINKIYPDGHIEVVATSTSIDGDVHGRII